MNNTLIISASWIEVLVGQLISLIWPVLFGLTTHFKVLNRISGTVQHCIRQMTIQCRQSTQLQCYVNWLLTPLYLLHIGYIYIYVYILKYHNIYTYIYIYVYIIPISSPSHPWCHNFSTVILYDLTWNYLHLPQWPEEMQLLQGLVSQLHQRHRGINELSRTLVNVPENKQIHPSFKQVRVGELVTQKWHHIWFLLGWKNRTFSDGCIGLSHLPGCPSAWCIMT